jgi:hypothetical protein
MERLTRLDMEQINNTKQLYANQNFIPPEIMFDLHQDNMRKFKISNWSFDEEKSEALFDIHDLRNTKVRKREISKPGVWMLTRGTGSSEECLYVGCGIGDLAYNISRYPKEYIGKSRHDEGQAAARRLKEEDGGETTELNLYYTTVIWPDFIGDNQKSFLVEMKKLFIHKFRPIHNSRYMKELVDG